MGCSDCEFGSPLNPPNLGDFKSKFPIQSPPEWGSWGAEAADNEARKLAELTFFSHDRATDEIFRLAKSLAALADPIEPRIFANAATPENCESPTTKAVGQ